MADPATPPGWKTVRMEHRLVYHHEVSGVYSVQLADCSVLTIIRSAQNNDGSFNLTPYSEALAEIVAGEKRGHWIWYVWPTHGEIRPDTGGPQFLLPSMEHFRSYLADEELRARLLEITLAATEHLENGVKSDILFGTDGDATKFFESVTLFAAAAAQSSVGAAGGDADRACLSQLCRALSALGGELPPHEAPLYATSMATVSKEWPRGAVASARTVGELLAAGPTINSCCSTS